MADENIIKLTTEMVASYVSNNIIPVSDIPALITSVYNSLVQLSQPEEPSPATVEQKPAVPIRKSVQADYIICLEDGIKCKMLKRHLMAAYGLTPDEYRQKWGLPINYPMVAPNYAKKRSELAVKLGLGRKKGS